MHNIIKEILIKAYNNNIKNYLIISNYIKTILSIDLNNLEKAITDILSEEFIIIEDNSDFLSFLFAFYDFIIELKFKNNTSKLNQETFNITPNNLKKVLSF